MVEGGSRGRVGDDGAVTSYELCDCYLRRRSLLTRHLGHFTRRTTRAGGDHEPGSGGGGGGGDLGVPCPEDSTWPRLTVGEIGTRPAAARRLVVKLVSRRLVSGGERGAWRSTV